MRVIPFVSVSIRRVAARFRCLVCGWHRRDPEFVHADAWRGFRRRLAMTPPTRTPWCGSRVCVWCRARGRVEP